MYQCHVLDPIVDAHENWCLRSEFASLGIIIFFLTEHTIVLVFINMQTQILKMREEPDSFLDVFIVLSLSSCDEGKVAHDLRPRKNASSVVTSKEFPTTKELLPPQELVIIWRVVNTGQYSVHADMLSLSMAFIYNTICAINK